MRTDRQVSFISVAMALLGVVVGVALPVAHGAYNPNSGVTGSTVGCLYRLTSSQSINDSTVTALSGYTSVFDTTGFYSAGSPTRFTIPANCGGQYTLTASISYANNGTGNRYIRIHKNGSLLTNLVQAPASVSAGGADSASCAVITLSLAAADYLELEAFQTSGGALNATSGAFGGGNTTFMSLTAQLTSGASPGLASVLGVSPGSGPNNITMASGQAVQFGNGNAGLSSSGAGVVDVGNGTNADTSGSLFGTQLNATNLTPSGAVNAVNGTGGITNLDGAGASRDSVFFATDSSAVGFPSSPRALIDTVQDSNATHGGIYMSRATATAAVGANMIFRRSRGTIASPTNAVLGDSLGSILGVGYAGSSGGDNFPHTSQIQLCVDSNGTVSSSSIPGMISFLVNANGSVLAPTNAAWAIRSTGNLAGNSSTGLTWANNADAASSTAMDTGVFRKGAALVAVGNGAAGDVSGQIQCASTTGSGTATFAATNCPAITTTSVFTWVKITAQDGSQVYVPAWK